MRVHAGIVACMAMVGALAACARRPEPPPVDASAHRATLDAWHTAQHGFRYVKAVRDTATDVVLLDFNYAYNPDCAYTPYATCPLAPAENRIKTRIAAGEEAYESSAAERK